MPPRSRRQQQQEQQPPSTSTADEEKLGKRDPENVLSDDPSSSDFDDDDDDPVVAELDLVLCQPLPLADVAVLRFPLVGSARRDLFERSYGDVRAARVKPDARAFEAVVPLVGVGKSGGGFGVYEDDDDDDGDDDEGDDDEDGDEEMEEEDGGRRRRNSRGGGGGRRATASAPRRRPKVDTTAVNSGVVRLAGTVTPTEGRKMLAARRGGTLYLIPVASTVCLLPSLSHLDAG